MECSRAASLVDAYLDTELDPVHALELESHLRACARCTALLAGRRTLQQALRTHLPCYKTPADLQRRLRRATAPRRRYGPWTAGIAACLVALIGLAVLLRPTPPAADPLATLADAVETDHVRSLLASHLTDVLSSDQHTVKPWFAGKLPFAPPVPDLAAQGFPLIGGRLDMLGHQPSAALVYARAKHTINLFVWPASAAPPLPAVPLARTTAAGYHIVLWSDSQMACAAVSDVETAELLDFARLFRAASTAPATTQ